MKKYLKAHLKDLSLFLAFILFLVVSSVFNAQLAKEVGSNFMGFLKEMITFLPLMFVLIGLFDVWFPREKLEKYIGRDSGAGGVFWIILLAMLQAGPLYGAFPVAALLWKKGAGTRNVFIYLGAFSTMKIPMLAFETGFLGIKFTLLRTSVSLPVFILIAFIMELYLKNRDFKVIDPAEEKE